MEPILLPMIVVEPVSSDELRESVRRLGSYAWVVLTSANSVESLAGMARRLGSSLEDLAGQARFAVVGRKTAEALAETGVSPALVADPPTARGLLAALAAAGVVEKRVLVPSSRLADPALSRDLARAGAIVHAPVAYDTVAPRAIDPAVVEMINLGQVDVVTFFSPSAVHNFAALVSPSLPPQVSIACVGPTTAEAALELGYRVDIVPGEPSAESVVDALLTWFAAAAR
jgi:uroporphyrinogen-III synthase